MLLAVLSRVAFRAPDEDSSARPRATRSAARQDPQLPRRPAGAAWTSSTPRAACEARGRAARAEARRPDAGLEQLLDAFLDAQPQHRAAGPQGRHHPRRALPVRPHAPSTASPRPRWRRPCSACWSASPLHEKQDHLHRRQGASSTSRSCKGHPYGETSLRHLLTMSSGVDVPRGLRRRDDGACCSRNTLRPAGPRAAPTRCCAFNERDAPAGHAVPLRLGRQPGARPGAARRGDQQAARRLPLREDLAADGRRGRRHLAGRQGAATRSATAASTPRCATTRASACCSPTTARSTASRSSPREWVKAATTRRGAAPARRHRHAEQRLRLPDLAASHRERAALRRARRRTARPSSSIPRRKLVVVHTAVCGRRRRPRRARRPVHALGSTARRLQYWKPT